MNARTILILATVTVGFGAAAMLTSREKHSADPAAGYLYPGLIDQVNEVAKVAVKNKDETYTLQKDGDGWGMAERSGYAVPIDKVREITNQIAFFEILEEKTRTPSLYSKLSVEDVETPEAGSTRITLSSADGQVLADVLVGKPSANSDPMAPGSLFVRKTGDAQSYEVKGKLNVTGTSVSMLETEIVKIERERVRRVVTTHPDGERLELVKDERTDANLTVQGIPEGREVKYPAVTDTIGSALAYLNFDDVKKAGEVDFDKPDAVTCEYETWDGLRVLVKTVKQKDNDYLSLSVSFDPSLRADPVVSVPPPEGSEDPAPPPDQPLKPEDEVRKEAEDLQAHLSQWVFKVQGYRASNYKKRMPDMLKDLPEEEPEIDPLQQAIEQPPEIPFEDPPEDRPAVAKADADARFGPISMFDRDTRGDVARLRFAHKKASALDLEFLEALDAELRETESSRARALVLTGTGSIFSAGVDLFRILDGGRDYIAAFLPALERVCLRLLRFKKPLVAAVNGHAIAGGCVIACACDAKLFARGKGKIGVPELKVGVPFPPAALEILRFALAPHVLQAAVVSGDTYGPEQALARGFVDELVDPEQLDERAFAVAAQMAEIPTESFAHTKGLLRGPAEDFLLRHAEEKNAEILERWSSVETLAAIRRYVDATIKK